MRIIANQYFTTICLCLIALPVKHAVGQELPNPPTYFSVFRVNLSVAQDVAKNCDKIEIDKQNFSAMAEDQFVRLERDGFTRENWRSEMKEIPKGLRERPNVEFYMKWAIKKNDQASYCAAGEMEIKNRSMIGKLLKKAEQ